MNKLDKEKIKQLKKEKRYDEIFIQYGSKKYLENTPYNYRRAELKKLKKEGKYEDIFSKYGEKEYKKILSKAIYNDIKVSKGKISAFIWKLKKKLKLFGATSLLTLSAASATFSYGTKYLIEENAVKYESEIEEYNRKNSEYAKEIKGYNLNDIQTYMKVMDDMWKNIKGYGEPEKDVSGFLELDLATEEGQGVCRHMASDVAKKLNEINPEYNARTLTVLMGQDGNYQVADIERNIVESNETVKDEEQNSNVEKSDNSITNEISKQLIKALGNHMVTLVDSKEDNLTLVLDPTNPGIGIYKNGNIIMLNSDKSDELKYDSKEYSKAVFFEGGIEGLKNVSLDYFKSFEKSNLTNKEIEEKYGIEAQNNALKEVRKKEIESKENNIRNLYKVDLSEKDNKENDNNLQKYTEIKKINKIENNEIER